MEFYNLGQGSFSMMFTAGFYILGKVKKTTEHCKLSVS